MVKCYFNLQFSGINYTNEMIEKTLKAKQAATLKSSCLENNLSLTKTNCNCNNSNVEANNKISISVIKFDEKKDIEDEENILKRCKLNKNAAIIGLLKSHKISLSDLQIPSDSIRVKDKGDINIQVCINCYVKIYGYYTYTINQMSYNKKHLYNRMKILLHHVI